MCGWMVGGKCFARDVLCSGGKSSLTLIVDVWRAVGVGASLSKRRGNMKKLTRSQRKRKKMLKEKLVEKGLEEGVGVQLEAQEEHVDKEPSEKARRRVERLKKKKLEGSENDERAPKRIEAQNGSTGVELESDEHVADWVWSKYSSAFGYGDQVRQASGLVASTICAIRPGKKQQSVCRITVSSLESSLKEIAGSNAPKTFQTEPSVLGQPTTLFISSSAIGALDLLRACPNFHGYCRIAKLFAKHMKLKEQVDYLQQRPINIATGTPNRLLKLATDGNLDFSRLKFIVFDARRNTKSFTLLDIPEISADLWKLWDGFLKSCCSSDGNGVKLIVLSE